MPPTLDPSPLDGIAHVIQVALAPAFLLSALATLLNVFSTRLGRVADQVDALAGHLESAGPQDAERMRRRLAHLHRRSMTLDIAVILASLGGALTGASVLALFFGALRNASIASILFGCFGAALVCTVGAIAAFLTEILLAGRLVRLDVAHKQDRVDAASGGPRQQHHGQ